MPRFIVILAFALAHIHVGAAYGDEPATPSSNKNRPLKALLIAGGCCHDYAAQHKVLYEGIQKRANVRVDVYWTDDNSTNPPFPLFDNANWADGYDVIIHDECAANNTNVEVVRRILDAHTTVPAVHLHCAMHNFRNGTDLWFKHLGLASTGHGPQKPIDVNFVDKEHPITQGLSGWTTGNEELYNNKELLNAHPLAMGTQTVERGGKQTVEKSVVVWTTDTGGARSFSTTLGHNTSTVADPKYLDLVTRGLLWACGKLTPEYQTPYEGENTITFIKKPDAPLKPQADPKMSAKKSKKQAALAPQDTTLVKVTASTVQSGHPPGDAVDGDAETRWCAENDNFPQWYTIEFEQPHTLTAIRIDWERNAAYRHKVEGSADGKQWAMLLDATQNPPAKAEFQTLATASPVKLVRISGLGTQGGGWCSIREIALKGEGVKTLRPAAEKAEGFQAAVTDPYKDGGNIPPHIEPLTAEQRAAILKDVKVPDGFEATVFAAPPAVNYPVFVTAAPDGTLFVSSDGNGSLGRSPNRGRVIRLRDTDGDGTADETKVFCEVDAPRGLVWDRDRLYLMHPPHLSVFIDANGDGVAEDEKVLVKNLAFGYDQRPADHTTNGVSLGVDGWLYIAGGDFGFMNAEGTDGRKLTHRGGGVIRVRPDGTGLEVYSTGTRNILEVAVSPRMEMFARDNTNDGGGWDVRLHHFTGGDDHGYPRLYKNFADECVAPLADYGGGSGCGAVYIDEPGFGDWNDAPFTADWGTGALYRHSVRPKGATFEEFSKPEPFIRMTRPTDADVDANGHVYCASWKGATFNWEGPNVGYIVRVTPKNLTAAPLPNFTKLDDDALVKLFDSPSYRRRVAAQRELAHRGNDQQQQLLAAGTAVRSDDRNLAERLQHDATDAQVVAALSHADPVILHIAVRELAQRGAADACFAAIDGSSHPAEGLFRALAKMHTPEVVSSLLTRLQQSREPEARRLMLAALCRLHYREGEWKGDSWGTRPDTRGPYYQPEAWSETPKIAAALKGTLATATPEEAAFLIREMNRNRIQSSDAIDRIIALAAQDEALVGEAVLQMAATDNVPAAGLPLALRVSRDSQASAAVLAATVIVLAKQNDPQAVSAMLSAVATLEGRDGAGKELELARETFLKAENLDAQIEVLRATAEQASQPTALWADAALLTVASRKEGSPESRHMARQTIEQAWQNPARQIALMQASAKIKSYAIEDQILAAKDDANDEVAQVARKTASTLKLKASNDATPKLATLELSDALSQAIAAHGDAARGELLLTKANCLACHTVRKEEQQKGPFLGSIARTYTRQQLAESILQPSKTIAQGFATTVILTVDGLVVTGFVTNESADRVTLRNAEAKEYVVLKDNIEERLTQPNSMMPEGLLKEHSVHDLASILDYLQALAQE